MSVAIFIVFVIVMIIISVVATRAMNKQKGVFSQYLTSGEEEERKGNDRVAVPLYKHALAVILGVEQGSVDLTAKGIGMMMDQEGGKAVVKLGTLYARNGIQYSWDEFNAIITEIRKMSINSALVDRHGLPKGAGKEFFATLKDRLVRCIHSMPELDASNVAPAPAASQPLTTVQPAAVTPPATFTQSVPPPIPPSQAVPSADSYAAKNVAAKKRNRTILWVLIGVLVLCIGILCLVLIIGPMIAVNSGVTNSVINSISTTAP
jgi:hypothetical protein